MPRKKYKTVTVEINLGDYPGWEEVEMTAVDLRGQGCVDLDLRIEYNWEYGECGHYIVMSGQRPETDEERGTRLHKEKKWRKDIQEVKEARERAELRKLAEKYPEELK